MRVGAWMQHSLLILVSVVALLASGCTRPLGKVIKVNDLTITELDIEYRAKVARYYFPEYQGDINAAAKTQLINAFVLAEILKRNGRSLDEAALKVEADRIKSSTLMPEKLEQIRGLFGKDEASYLKVYVLPVLAERTIFYDFFLHDPKVQEQSLQLAQNVLNELNAGNGDFAERMKSKALKELLPADFRAQPFKFKVSLKAGLEMVLDDKDQAAPTGQQANQPPAKVTQKLEKAQAAQQNEEGKKWLTDVIRPLKQGQLYDKVVDRQEAWWVVRFVGRDKADSDVFWMEGLSLPKANYEKWLEAEKQKIKVQE